MYNCLRVRDNGKKIRNSEWKGQYMKWNCLRFLLLYCIVLYLFFFLSKNLFNFLLFHYFFPIFPFLAKKKMWDDSTHFFKRGMWLMKIHKSRRIRKHDNLKFIMYFSYFYCLDTIFIKIYQAFPIFVCVCVWWSHTNFVYMESSRQSVNKSSYIWI